MMIGWANDTYLRTKYEIRSFLGKYPTIVLPLIRLKKKEGSLVVCRNTEVVIEGFPRSGNSFAVIAFSMAQSRPLVMAHHLHVPAQVIHAVRKGIPTLVLVRKPSDAILSFLIRHPYISPRQATADYIRFYSVIYPYREGFVVGLFEEVISNFGITIERMNQRFGTDFALFEHKQANVEACFRQIEEIHLEQLGKNEVTESIVARPSPQRERARRIVARELRTGAGELKELFSNAEALFKQFSGLNNDLNCRAVVQRSKETKSE